MLSAFNRRLEVHFIPWVRLPWLIPAPEGVVLHDEMLSISVDLLISKVHLFHHVKNNVLFSQNLKIELVWENEHDVCCIYIVSAAPWTFVKIDLACYKYLLLFIHYLFMMLTNCCKCNMAFTERLNLRHWKFILVNFSPLDWKAVCTQTLRMLFVGSTDVTLFSLFLQK